MGNRCREGSLGKNNLPQSLNDHTCSRVVKAFRTDCLCVFDDISFCFFSIIAHCACCSSMIHLILLFFPTSQTFLSSFCSHSLLLMKKQKEKEAVTRIVFALLVLSRYQEATSTRNLISARSVFFTRIGERKKETKRFIITASDVMHPTAKNNAQNMP